MVVQTPDRGTKPPPRGPQPPRTLLRRLTLWLEQARALRGWIDEARAGSPALDATFETIERDSELGGNILAGAVAYRLFVFMLPLAFFLVSGVGLLASAVGVKADVIVNSVGFAGVVTKQVANASKGSSSWWVAITSFVALVYATRVLLLAVAKVHSLAWERSAASVKISSRALGIFGLAIVGQVALGAAVTGLNHKTLLGGILGFLVFLALLAALWLLVSLELPHSDARWTDLIPGSLFYATGLVGVQIFNILLLGRLIQSKASTYGALGMAATLLLGFFLVGRVMVGAAVLNATLYQRRTRSDDETS